MRSSIKFVGDPRAFKISAGSSRSRVSDVILDGFGAGEAGDLMTGAREPSRSGGAGASQDVLGSTFSPRVVMRHMENMPGDLVENARVEWHLRHMLARYQAAVRDGEWTGNGVGSAELTPAAT